MMRSVRRIRGSSLVTVVLVILVLTIIGVAIAYFTQVEDRLSGNTRIQRASFYVAEAGLRKGETVLLALFASLGTAPTGLDDALQFNFGDPTKKITVPGGLPGDYQAVLLHAKDPEDSVVKDFLNIPINPPTGQEIDRGQFSLYVRNNVEDLTGDDQHDKDQVLNLVSVGKIILPGAAGTTMTTILEEQLQNSSVGSSSGVMKNLDAGSTNTILKGRQS